MVVYSSTGSRVSQSTGIDILLREDFEIEINNTRYRVSVADEREWAVLFVLI